MQPDATRYSAMGGDTQIVTAYADRIAQKKRLLFDLYQGEDIQPVAFARGGGWTRGYRLFVAGEWATGSSIGEDEIRLFFDLPCLIGATSIYTVGVAFGLSTFNLALAKAGTRVFAIDNYSKRPGEETVYARELVERLVRERVPNVHLHVGSSPEEVDDCLASLDPAERLSLVFIDGLHTDAAAEADYRAVERYLDSRSVVLWHNTYATRKAFDACFPEHLFDRKLVLHSYGVMGVYYHSEEHPRLEAYFRDNCLVWEGWEEHVRRVLAEPQLELSWGEQQLIGACRRVLSLVGLRRHEGAAETAT